MALVLARLVVVAACIAAVVVFAQRRDDAAACRDARTQLFQAGLHGRAPARLIAQVRDDCRDPEQVALAAVGVASSRDTRAAAALARVAVRREPDGFSGWAALAVALRDDDPAGSARAARRARELNPRWRAPAGVGGAAAGRP